MTPVRAGLLSYLASATLPVAPPPSSSSSSFHPANRTAYEFSTVAQFNTYMAQIKSGTRNPKNDKFVMTDDIAGRLEVPKDTSNDLIVIESKRTSLANVKNAAELKGGLTAKSPVWLYGFRAANYDDSVNQNESDKPGAARTCIELSQGSAGSKITHSFLQGQTAIGSGHKAVSNTPAVPDITLAFNHIYSGKENRNNTSQVYVSLVNSSNYDLLAHRWTFYRNIFETEGSDYYSEDNHVYVAHGWDSNTNTSTDRVTVDNWSFIENFFCGNPTRSLYLKQVGKGTVIRDNRYSMTGFRGDFILRGNATSEIEVKGEWYEKMGSIYIQGIKHTFNGCDFGNHTVRLSCTGKHSGNNKIQEGADGLVMWGCKGGNFKLGAVSGTTLIEFHKMLKNVKFEKLDNPKSWLEEETKKAITWTKNGTISSKHTYIEASSITKSDDTSRTIYSRTNLQRSDCGPGASV